MLTELEGFVSAQKFFFFLVKEVHALLPSEKYF